MACLYPQHQHLHLQYRSRRPPPLGRRRRRYCPLANITVLQEVFH